MGPFGVDGRCRDGACRRAIPQRRRCRGGSSAGRGDPLCDGLGYGNVVAANDGPQKSQSSSVEVIMNALQPPVDRDAFEAVLLHNCDLNVYAGEGTLLEKSMKYIVSAGGKRIRAALCVAGYRYAMRERGCDRSTDSDDSVLVMATAVEMMHSASLVLDDLPCMDNAATRRAKPCVHISHGEANALLAASALVSLAFLAAIEVGVKVNLTICDNQGAGSRISLELICASVRMAIGQSMDINVKAESVDVVVDEAKVMQVHAEKTGSLIVASVVCGAICGGADRACLERVRRYANKLGAAYQIADDLIDATMTETQAGKPTGTDAGKPSYVEAVGVEAAEAAVDRLMLEAINSLIRDQDGDLTRIARSLVGRCAYSTPLQNSCKSAL